MSGAAYFSSTPWHPVGCRCGECGDGGLAGAPHQHEDDFDADTCEICFPPAAAPVLWQGERQ